MSEKAGSTHVAFLVYRLWWIGGILHGTAAVRVICCSVVSVMPVIFCFHVMDTRSVYPVQDIPSDGGT